ncbi:AI-2E family transporter [Lactobacillus selangorensis]|uniref:AI-2E family transporter n=1 Tax=Lactobacillus selangorensis TaxID=81857 RepID=UPI0022A8FFEE|nr:AI-2E family transporter [Lactobacillus selangorensis]
MEKQSKSSPFSWFFKWFLNNKLTIVLLNTLLVLIVLFLIKKVAWIFTPLTDAVNAVELPVIIAAVLYYVLNPLVDWVEKHWYWKRWVTIALIFIALLGLIVWGLATLIPAVENQLQELAKTWPQYWEGIQKNLNQWLGHYDLDSLKKQFDTFTQGTGKTITTRINSFVESTLGGIGTAVGVVTNVVIAFATAPFLLFFMLKDGHRFSHFVVHFLPTKTRSTTHEMLTEINQQISQYIRGQLTVALCVALMFMFGFWVVGMKYALTLGLLAGIMNLIPYLGSFLAMLPALVIAAFISPIMLLKVIAVFAIEQMLEGQVVSPLVLGNSMDMYPVTTILVLLITGNMFGIVGMILGIPLFAILKIFCTYGFHWFKQVSGLYEEEKTVPTKPTIKKADS